MVRSVGADVDDRDVAPREEDAACSHIRKPISCRSAQANDFLGNLLLSGARLPIDLREMLQFRNVQPRIDPTAIRCEMAFSDAPDTVYNYSIPLYGETEPHMKANYSIADIEQAINYWTSHQAADSNLSLCKSARALANVYGEMIYRRATSVAAESLNAKQSQALETALHQMELGLAP